MAFIQELHSIKRFYWLSFFPSQIVLSEAQSKVCINKSEYLPFLLLEGILLMKELVYYVLV